MDPYAFAIVTAFWLGILTSISPCPLATNIAAMSYVAQRVGNPKLVFITGLLYSAGRTLTYTVLGMVLIQSLLSAPTVSNVLQKYMNLAFGPLMILVGMILTEMLVFNLGGCGIGEKLKQRAGEAGSWGALLLGIIFALSFCPTSAALFFGSLLPLSIQHKSIIALPAIYGLATGLPVLSFALLIAIGLGKIAKAYDKVVAFELWARKGTGIIFITVGIYHSLTTIFGVDLSR